MPNESEQPAGRAGRRTPVILLVAAAVVAGLWYALERPRPAEPASGTAPPAAADSRTGDSGAASRSNDAQAADSDAAARSNDAQAADSDAAARSNDAQAADSDAASRSNDAQAADSDAAARDSGAQAADSGAAFPDRRAQTAHSGNTSTGGLQTAGSGAAASREPDRPAAPETTGDPVRITAGTGAAPVDGAPVDETPRVAAAPDSAIEKVLVDAPSDPVDAPSDPVDASSGTETAGKTSLLAAIESVIERIEEWRRTGPEAAPDSKLELQITYDDPKRDTARTGLAPNEPDRAAGSDATRPPDHAQSSGADDGAGAAAARSPEPPKPLEPPKSPEPAVSTASSGAPSSDPVAGVAGIPAGTGTGLETEAEEYVERLTGTAPWTIPVDKADHFVTPEHVISLVPEDSIENVSIDELAGDETLSPDTLFTVVREVEQIEEVGAERIIAEWGSDPDRELRVQVTYDDSRDQAAPKAVEADTVELITVREALERVRAEPDKPLPVVRKVRHFEVLTLKELLESTAGGETFLKVITRPYRIESATLADLLRRQQAEHPDSIFYIHTVQPTDEQGIWGIVHFGLIDNFARGMAVRRGEDIETYTVRIPRDADERLADRSSSFLGLMIDRKTRDSYVYNFRDHRIGRNPDRIFPGQELVIINFQPEDLIAIYRHFTAS